MSPDKPSNGQTALTCPVCSGPLIIGPTVANCEKNHTFDRAREGYFNLLLANQKGSNDPGDDRDAVGARREFLAAGHYDFLSEALEQQVARYHGSQEIIVDAGCGEGLYLSRLAKVCSGSDIYGLDISRSAMRLASRSFPDCTWAVTNIARHLPIRDTCCNILLSVMAPRNPEEFRRILRPDGLLIAVLPGKNHLQELTDILMANPSDQSEKADALIQSISSAFKLQHTESIRSRFTANQQTIQRLVTMTPLRWKSQKAALGTLAEIDVLEITASFSVLTFSPST